MLSLIDSERWQHYAIGWQCVGIAICTCQQWTPNGYALEHERHERESEGIQTFLFEILNFLSLTENSDDRRINQGAG